LKQWGICVGFGAITLPVAQVIKRLPLEPYIERFINIIYGGSNKIGNSNADPKSKDQSIVNNNQVQVLNVNEFANQPNQANPQIRKETSSKRKASVVDTIVKSRSKQLGKSGGSHQSLRKDKEN